MMSLWLKLKRSMLEHPAQLVCEQTDTLRFEELVVKTEQLAERLSGISCCAIDCASEWMAARALLACFAAGVTAVPLSRRYGEMHSRNILDTIRPDAVIRDETGSLAVVKRPGASYQAPELHPALIMCTSGTTGRPKGVMLTEQCILTNLSDIAEYFAIGERDAILIARPLYHCAVLTGEFLAALVKGANIRFVSETFHPPAMLKWIRQYGITTVCGTPTLLGLMSRFVRSDSTLPLRHIVISGECMSKETGLRIADAFPQANIYHVYGLTEASPRVSYLPPELFRKYPDCVGIPLNSVEILVQKENCTAANVDEQGMLYVRGGNVMSGYYGEPEKSNLLLKGGWLCTGDLATINSAGLLKICGRTDDLIIKAGMNIYPQEIEGTLKTDPRVREVLAYGYTASTSTQIGLQISGDFALVEEVRTLCAKYLPPYQMPMRIELLPELEKNGSGKIKRGRRNA